MTPAGRLGRLRQAVWQQTDTSPSVPDGGSGTDHLALITFAARVGARALVSGASAAETTGMILRLAWGCGVPCQVDVTFTSITVSISESVDSGPLTVMRTVPQLDRDYAQLGELERLVAQVTEGRMTLAHAEEELDHFTRHRMQYRTWVLRVAAFGQGAGICALLGGDLREMLLAGFATLLIELTLRMLARRRATYFTGQVVAGAIPMIIGVGLMYGRTHGLPELWLLRPSLIAAAGMVTMLAGLGVVGAAQDALDGYFVTATARVGDLLMRTGGLILGVVGVLWISLQLGIPAYLTAEALRPPEPVWQAVAAGAFALFFAVHVRLGPRGALVGAAFGALGWAVYLVALLVSDGERALASGVGAFAVALLAQALSRRLALPAIALITVGVAPLMPGLLLYRSLYGFIVGTSPVEPGDAGADLFILALTTGVALALGTSLGASWGRAISLPQEQGERRAVLASLRRSRLRRR